MGKFDIFCIFTVKTLYLLCFCTVIALLFCPVSGIFPLYDTEYSICCTLLCSIKSKLVTFAAGKPYTTSSCITPPGSEESKGTVVERCDVSSLPFFSEPEWQLFKAPIGFIQKKRPHDQCVALTGPLKYYVVYLSSGEMIFSTSISNSKGEYGLISFPAALGP